MRIWAFSLLAIVLSTAPALGQDDASVDEVRALLVEVCDGFEAAIEGINERQWQYLAPDQRHTIGALAEHTALSANDLQRMVQRALDGQPQEEVAKSLSGQVQVVKDIMLNEEQPPENFRPAGRLLTRTDVDEYFPQVRAKLMALLATARYPEIYVSGHPSERVGKLTALQWFYYIAYLTQAHTEQIERIKADPGFPLE